MRMSRRADTKGASKTDRRRSMFNMPGGTTAGAGPGASSRNAFARPSSADGTVYDAKKGVINDRRATFKTSLSPMCSNGSPARWKWNSN